MKPIAAIDIGTNSVHLVVAKVDDHGHINRIDTDKVNLRLGEHISEDGYITKDGIRGCVHTIKQMQAIASAYTTDCRAVATYATRSSRNYAELIRAVQQACGIKIEVIDGFEEARLIYLGMREGLHLKGQMLLGVDIGGGSTEIVAAKGEDILDITSLSLGAVNLTRTHFGKKPPTSSKLQDLRQHIDAHVQPLKEEFGQHTYEVAVATSGTAKALANIHAEMNGRKLSDSNGYTVPAKDLHNIIKELAELGSKDAIVNRFSIDARRAEILLAGAEIIGLITKYFGIKVWTICTYGLREGLVVDTFNRIVGDMGPDRSADIRSRSLKQFAQKYAVDIRHAINVQRLATRIVRQLHNLGLAKDIATHIDDDRLVLEAAALLHEAGKFVNHSGYHKHSRYLIANGHLLGFTQGERLMIANIVRFHRKSVPTRTHMDSNQLSISELDRLRFLSAILRLTVPLNRTRQDRVQDVVVSRTNGKIVFEVIAASPESIEVEMRSLEREVNTIGRCLENEIVVVFRGEP